MFGGFSEKKYEYLYHTADAKFRAYGKTLEEAFENAALAMFNVMIDTSILKLDQMREIELTSQDIEILLVDWLSELLYLLEVDNIVFGRFEVHGIEKTEEGLSLSAHASGETIDISRHRFDTQVKAVTFHELDIKRDDGFSVQVIVDT